MKDHPENCKTTESHMSKAVQRSLEEWVWNHTVWSPGALGKRRGEQVVMAPIYLNGGQSNSGFLFCVV